MKRVGHADDLFRPYALEATAEVLDQRLGEQDVADQPVNPGSLTEGKRIEVGELTPERRLDRIQDVPHARV